MCCDQIFLALNGELSAQLYREDNFLKSQHRTHKAAETMRVPLYVVCYLTKTHNLSLKLLESIAFCLKGNRNQDYMQTQTR